MKDCLSRRKLLKGAVGAAGLVTTSGLAACGDASSIPAQAGNTIRIGYISPVTGDASAFGQTTDYVIQRVAEALSDRIAIGGRTYQVEILDRDSQSNPNVAASLATQLIHNERVDLMLANSTPETVNPVSDVCEASGIPCLSTAVPWEAWYFGRGATPEQPFNYTYHFFIGMAEVATAYTSLWLDGPIETNKRVGVMWPDDPDGRAVRTNLGPELEQAGLEIVDPGAYQNGIDDYSSQIQLLMQSDIDVFNAFPIHTDFITFWRQARQEGLRPKIATVAKTGLVPSQVEELGEAGFGLSTGFWWTPSFPYASPLTGETATQLTHHYEGWTDRQWTQTLGSQLALFEVAVDALKRVSDPKDREELAAALGATQMTTVVGPLDFTSGPVPNVSTEPLVIAQWRRLKVGRFAAHPVIVDNAGFRDIPLGGSMEPLD